MRVQDVQDQWGELPSFIFSTKLRVASPYASMAAIVLLALVVGTYLGIFVFHSKHTITVVGRCDHS